MKIREVKIDKIALSWFRKGQASDSNYLKINYFSHAIEKTPDYKDALFHRGLVYNDLSRFEEAANDFTQIISLYPNSVITGMRCVPVMWSL